MSLDPHNVKGVIKYLCGSEDGSAFLRKEDLFAFFDVEKISTAQLETYLQELIAEGDIEVYKDLDTNEDNYVSVWKRH